MEFTKSIAKMYSFLFDNENNLWVDLAGIVFFSCLLILLFSTSA